MKWYSLNLVVLVCLCAIIKTTFGPSNRPAPTLSYASFRFLPRVVLPHIFASKNFSDAVSYLTGLLFDISFLVRAFKFPVFVLFVLFIYFPARCWAFDVLSDTFVITR